MRRPRPSARAAGPTVGDAKQISLTRIRQSALRRPATFWPQLAIAAAAVLAIVVGSLGINEAVGRFQIPERELVAEASEALGGDSLVLRVEDGRFAAGPSQTSGVLVSAELRLATPVRGSAELRFAATGEPYGILASAPNLDGITRLHLENTLTTVDSATVMEFWLHIEGTEPRDSGHIAVRIESTHGGLRARSLR
jgi:hypothetical protein